MTFSQFSASYAHPRNRGDMKCAEKRFQRIAKAGELEALGKALEAYAAYQRDNSWYQPLMLSSYLGGKTSERWRDWLTDKQMRRDLNEQVDALIVGEVLQARARGIQREQQRQVERGMRVAVMSVEEILGRLKA